MPKKDKFHDLVIRAFQKEGWILIKEQVMLYIESRILKIDLHLQKQNEEILVEVKSFDSGSSVIDITDAIGKYVVYHAILEDNEDARPLYLAIPTTAYEGIFSERLGQLCKAATSSESLCTMLQRRRLSYGYHKRIAFELPQ